MYPITKAKRYSEPRSQFAHATDWGRLIDDQPVQAHVLDRLPELVEVDRLLDIAVSSQVVTARQVPLLFRGGHNNDWDVLGPQVTLDLFEHFHPIHFGKFQVQQYQFGRMLKRSM